MPHRDERIDDMMQALAAPDLEMPESLRVELARRRRTIRARRIGFGTGVLTALVAGVAATLVFVETNDGDQRQANVGGTTESGHRVQGAFEPAATIGVETGEERSWLTLADGESVPTIGTRSWAGL